MSKLTLRYPRIHHAVFFEPWAILESKHASIRAVLEAAMQGNMLDLLDERKPAEYAVADGIGIIPIEGVIGKGLSTMEKACGGVCVDEIGSMLGQAMADQSVQGIMLDINSPGGSVAGVPELADAISAASEVKPVMAYTDGEMASAAYWLAAGAKAIYATKSAVVGSIGVYIPWMDSSAFYAANGRKVEVIRNAGADLKGMGIPGTSLSDDQRAHLQEHVDQVAKMFHDHVTGNRPTVGAGAMRGQAMLGQPAADAGLTDGVQGFDHALKDLQTLIEMKKSRVG